MFNTIIFGSAGSGKTTQFIIPMIKRALFADGIVVVTDFNHYLTRRSEMDCVWKLMHRAELPCHPFDADENPASDEFINKEMFQAPGLTILNHEPCKKDQFRAVETLEKILIEAVSCQHDQPITIILDDVASFGTISNLSSYLKKASKRDVRFVPVFNSLTQMKELYPEDWSAILDLTQEKICVQTTDVQTADYFAKFDKKVHREDLMKMSKNTYFYVCESKAKFKQVS